MMEVSSLSRGYTAIQPVVTAPVSATANSVDTLLPQGSHSVAPIGASSDGPATGGGSGGGQAQSSVPGQSSTVAVFTRDASTNTLVFMEVDPQTEAVIVQFPDEHSLKVKSYLVEVQRREEAAQKSSPGSNIAKTS
jgi:hypothetical protein